MNKTLYLHIYNTEFNVRMEREDCTSTFDGITRPGIHYYVDIGDNREVSIIKKDGSYGYEDDLWEVALTDKECGLCFISDIFKELDDDVIGYLNEKEVNEWISKFYITFVKNEPA